MQEPDENSIIPSAVDNDPVIGMPSVCKTSLITLTPSGDQMIQSTAPPGGQLPQTTAPPGLQFSYHLCLSGCFGRFKKNRQMGGMQEATSGPNGSIPAW